jgi:hypothetical protein
MKRRIVNTFIFVIVIAFTLVLSVSAQEQIARQSDQKAFVSPLPQLPRYIPYVPFESREIFPDYLPVDKVPAAPSQMILSKPAGVDLDVTYISRSPLYNRYDVSYTPDGKPYLRPGSESDQRWPSPGELVTFTAHIFNKGTIASGSFSYKWFIDGVEVHSGTLSSLNPGQETTTTYQWAWAHTLDSERLLGSHTVRLTVDPGNIIAETYESNNSLEDRTDAISLVLAVTPELYTALETPVDAVYPFSAEDWLQKQIAAMNAAFIRSMYSSIPGGITERVRLDKILITSTEPSTDYAEDGGFFLSSDDRSGNGYYDPATDVSGSLIHELTHQLGIIDMYNLNVPLEVPQILDRLGQPVQIEYDAGNQYQGLMNNPGIRPPIYDEHSALALNANKGYRRGYYGEYLYDVPEHTYIRVLDSHGDPAAGVTVNLYQRSSDANLYGGHFGTIDNTPEISGVTDSSGLLLLSNRSTGESISTRTGHTLVDNPFGVINVVGNNDEFIVELMKGTHQEYGWLDIMSFNLARWRSGSDTATIDIPAHIPVNNAPLAPAHLGGIQEYGLVKLEWSSSPSASVASYNVYRASDPVYAYQKIATGLATLNYSVSYNYNARAAQFVVTVVDSLGHESGFSNIFYAFRMSDPKSIVVDESNLRIVLDSNHDYSLLYQLSDGTFNDTRGTYDLHLEFSSYLARDLQGRLIISHPADYYSSRHSVQVTDQDANLLFEFGDKGAEDGQFQSPAGVAVWGKPCTHEGPYTADPHTQLLLHFDGDYEGTDGEIGTVIGATFATGKYGSGVTIDSADTLTYPTAGNMNRSEGAIEFWLRPAWNGNDGISHTFFEVGNGWSNRMRIMKDGGNYLRFMVWDEITEYGANYYVGDWKAGEWHHVSATWTGTNIALFIDGVQRASDAISNLPSELADTIFIGSTIWQDQQADAAMDEFRISDIPRVGNSDTCNYRILVADSGNNRIEAFDSDGKFIGSYGSSGDGNGQFNNPQGLGVDGDFNVIVADSGNNRLQVFNFDGTNFSFLRSTTASFNEPTGLVAEGDHILVADTGNSTIKVLDTQGNLIEQYSAPTDGRTGTLNQPHGVAADHEGNIIVADTGNKRVVTILNVLPVLSISKDGTGDGTITSEPAGIDCGSTCSLPFLHNAVVTLTAVEDASSTFLGWSGGGCLGAGTCTVTMDDNKSVTATFKSDIRKIYLPLVIR